jgi:hypothetical protein
MQQLETLFINDASSITIDRDNRLITNTWLRPVTHQEMLQTSNRLYQFLQETKSDKLLLNALQAGTLQPETKEWLSTTFYRSLSELKLQKLARVLPVNLFNKLSFEAVLTRAEALGAIHFEVRNFTNEQAAAQWLRDQEPTDKPLYTIPR